MNSSVKKWLAQLATHTIHTILSLKWTFVMVYVAETFYVYTPFHHIAY